jgi:hypothetical protein
MAAADPADGKLRDVQPIIPGRQVSKAGGIKTIVADALPVGSSWLV